jgi:competence protein ComFC
MGLFDFIYPKRCVQCKAFGEYICANCFAGITFDVSMICLVCNKGAMDGVTHVKCQTKYTIDGASASVAYKGIVKKLVYQFKYKPYLTDLEHVMSDLFYEGLIQQEQFARLVEQKSILVPIPLHKDKYRRRGYNHAEILSKNLGKRLDMETKTILKRIKKTQTQANLKRVDRLVNLKDAFYLEESALQKIRHRQIILVDDIVTTGATMAEAAYTLKKNGIENVWGIALAHGL